MDETVSDIKKTMEILEDLKNKHKNINPEELQKNIKKFKQQIDDYCDEFTKSSLIRKSYNDNDIFYVCALLRHKFNEVMTIQKFEVITQEQWVYEDNCCFDNCRYPIAWKIQFNTQIESYKQCELKLEFINNWKHGRIYFKTEVVAEREINLFSDEPDVLLSNLFSYPSSIDKNLESLYYFKINDCLQFMILELIHDKCLSDPKAYNKADIYNWIYDHMIFPKISGIKDPKDLPGDY